MPNRREIFATAALCVLCAGVLLALVQPASADGTKPRYSSEAALKEKMQIISLKKGVIFYRGATWRWQDTMLANRTPTAYHERWAKGVAYLRWLAKLWIKRSQRAKQKASNPPHRAAWQCIHRYEGVWNDPGSPYYGGLQMDLSFQRAYGWRLLRSKGTADSWTPLEQMWVAEKAYRSGRGFYPWPNTARFCGLI